MQPSTPGEKLERLLAFAGRPQSLRISLKLWLAGRASSDSGTAVERKSKTLQGASMVPMSHSTTARV
eukprot:jgi/Tetstr1/461859/TSEL_006938.t1